MAPGEATFEFQAAKCIEPGQQNGADGKYQTRGLAGILSNSVSKENLQNVTCHFGIRPSDVSCFRDIAE